MTARPRRLSDADWQWLFWTACLSEHEGEVFLRREVLEESGPRVARQLETTAAAIRTSLNLAWKKLQEHPWTPVDVAWVRGKLRPYQDEPWAVSLAAVVRRGGPTVYRRSRIVAILR